MGKQRGRRVGVPSFFSLLEGPPETQLANRKAMAAHWNDPDDTSPNRRSAREVKGWRAYCPLRRLRERANGSGLISAEHVSAADQLRLLADGARIGFYGGRDLSVPIWAGVFKPSTGPGQTALKRVRCERGFARCMQTFDAEQQELIEGIILDNMPIDRWRRSRGIASHTTVMARLVAVLDLLVDYFDDEIRHHGLTA